MSNDYAEVRHPAGPDYTLDQFTRDVRDAAVRFKASLAIAIMQGLKAKKDETQLFALMANQMQQMENIEMDDPEILAVARDMGYDLKKEGN